MVYLVAAGSADGFRRAVREACTRWGGITEPIVEVGVEGELSNEVRNMIEAADVQAAVNVDVEAQRAASIARLVELPLVPIAGIDDEDSGLAPCSWAAVFADPGGVGLVVAEEQAPLWQVAVAGDLDDEVLAQAQTLCAVRRPMTDAEIGPAQLHGATLLERTTKQFREHGMEVATLAGGPITLVVTDPDDTAVCTWFWNLRALRSRLLAHSHVFLVPRSGVENWVGFSEQLVNFARACNGPSSEVAVFGPSISHDELQAFARSLGLTSKDAPKEPRRFTQPGGPVTFTVNRDPRSWLLHPRSWGLTTEVNAHFYAEGTTIEIPSPVRFDSAVLGSVLVRLRSAAFDGLPRRPGVADMISSGARWHRGRIETTRITTDGFSLRLTVPEPVEAARRLLDDATAEWGLSDKGRIAEGVVARQDPSVLLGQGVYEAIIALYTKRSKELLKELKRAHKSDSDDVALIELAQAWGGRVRRTYRSVAELKSDHGLREHRDEVPDVLEALCSVGWAERGLESRCGGCGHHTFVPLTETQGPASCPGCGVPARYSRGDEGPTVVYRLGTYIDQAADNGILPHLMTAAAVRADDPSSHLIPGVNTRFADGARREVDVYGVWHGKLVAGEVKTNPGAFDDEQLRHDIDTSARLGVDFHLMASVGAIPDERRDAAEALCIEHGLELAILDREDLRPQRAAVP
ncbi:hypothetical protein [Embleya sp. NPDC020630]|uniref:hypothetical protein n=1 Tax=Embleya sp. NPDC020630 TaxID=3363979 RepID=UPI0037A8AE4A